jgi:hypothetical protein
LGASPQAPAAGGGDSSATDGDDYGYDSPGLLGGAEPGAPPGLAQSDWPAAATQNEPFQPRAVAPFLKAPPTGGDDCPSTDSDDYGHDSPAGLGGGGEQSASLLVEVIPVPDDEIRREAMRSVAAMIDGLAAEINGLRQEMFSSQAARNAIFSRLSGV